MAEVAGPVGAALSLAVASGLSLLALGAGLLALAIAVTLTVWLGRRALGALGRLRRRGLPRAVAGRHGEA